MDDPAAGLRRFIKDEMRRREMTSIRQFAEFVDITPSTISRMISHTDPTNPKVESLNKIADATGVSLLTLIALVRPDIELVGNVSPESLALAQKLDRLPPRQRRQAQIILSGLLLQTEDNGV